MDCIKVKYSPRTSLEIGIAAYITGVGRGGFNNPVVVTGLSLNCSLIFCGLLM